MAKKSGKKEQSIASKPGDIGKVVSEETPFAIREAYNAIRTKLLFTAAEESCPVYVVSSALPHEGKTINAVNLAITYAQSGKRTLLLDADMRNPSVHRYFSANHKNGLSEVLAGLTNTIRIRVSNIPNLWFMPAGYILPNPAELLGTARLEELIRHLQKDFDCIFIDSPPVEVVTDASLLATKVTGYILIVYTGVSKSEVLAHTVETLQDLGGKIIGFVLNDIEGKGERYYRYGGGYYKTSYKYKYDYSYRYDGDH